MKKKLLFFDIDGTLIDSHKGIYTMRLKTRYRLDQLKKQGHQGFIASGRNFTFMPKEIRDYDFDGYINCNGASIHYQNKKYIKILLLQIS